MAVSSQPPSPATPIQRPGVTGNRLVNAEKILNTLKGQISNAAHLNQLIEDEEDMVYYVVENARKRLEKAIASYRTWIDSARKPQSPPQPAQIEPEKRPRKTIVKSAKGFFRTIFRSVPDAKTSESNDPKAEDPEKYATDALDDAMDNASAAISTLMESTIQRSCINAMGSYYMLVKSRRLSSTKNQAGKSLTGRYEETGGEMFALVTQFMSIENSLNDPDVLDGDAIAVSTVTRLYHKLGVACDVTIAFVLTVPFDLEGFEYATGRLRSYGERLQAFIRKEDPIENLFDGKKVPYDLASIDGSYGHERLGQDIDAIATYLKIRESEHILRKNKFDAEVTLSPILPQIRAIEHLGLKSGDLSNTETVIQCMRRPRSEGGLGLPVICEGNDIPAIRQKKGGYGMVSCTRLPSDACGVDEIKTLGRLVAVKVSQSSQSSDSLALANIRMLREAYLWTAVSSDPRSLADGGLYLAKVEGIWDNFQEQRPGLVSLWGESDLELYVRNNPLTTIQRLELALKVGQGVHFLHTCNPAIVHGDLKTANVIMIDGEPRLTDFGVGKCLDGLRGLTTGYGSYTDDYRAPEIQHRELSLVMYPTKESDVYAFGCLLFEILSGKAPFSGFDDTMRKSWTAKDMDRTPIDAELSLPNHHQFERLHLDLMKMCFIFHASRRPTMELVVQALQELIMMEQ